MTLGEVVRYLNAANRRKENELREKAFFDYRLADLIGISLGRFYAKNISYPEIYEVYPTMFSEEEIETARQEERDRLSIERLKRLVGK